MPATVGGGDETIPSTLVSRAHDRVDAVNRPGFLAASMRLRLSGEGRVVGLLELGGWDVAEQPLGMLKLWLTPGLL